MAKKYNDAWKKAFKTGKYKCPECGASMRFEDAMEDTLICTSCGFEEPTERYGYTDEEFEQLQSEMYPTAKDMGLWDEEDEEDFGENYDEVFNELEND